MKIDREALAISVGCLLDATRGARLDPTSQAARDRLKEWFRRWERPSPAGLSGIVRDRDRVQAAADMRPRLKRGDVITHNRARHLYVGTASDGTQWLCRLDRRDGFEAMSQEFDRRNQ